MTLKQRLLRNWPNLLIYVVGLALAVLALEYILVPHATRGLYSLYYCTQHDCDKLRLVFNTLLFSGFVSFIFLILLRYRYIRVSCSIVSVVGVTTLMYPISQFLSSSMTIVHDERLNMSIILVFMNMILLMLQSCVYYARTTIKTSDII